MQTRTDRKVVRVVHKVETMEGAGVVVGRALPNRDVPHEEVDPFLLWDEAEIDPDGPAFPRHPHRGFEILTYPLRGWINHVDSLGNEARVQAGGIMHITAGKGIWHEEGFGEKNHQPIRGIQFWVNLPLAEKQREPSLQVAGETDLPVTDQDGVRLKVLVGPGSPIQLVTPVHYLDVTVQPGAAFSWPAPPDFQGFAYVLDGVGLFGPEATRGLKGDLVVWGEGERVTAVAGEEMPTRFMLALGRPHRQPVSWHGSYVD